MKIMCKKHVAMLFVTVLCLATCLVAFAEDSAPDFSPDITPAPAYLDDPGATEPASTEPESTEPASTDGALETPVPTEAPEPDKPEEDTRVSDISYAQYSSDEHNLKMDYPSTWAQIPSRHTICYLENVADGQIPARMAFTRKKGDYAPKEDTIKSQLKSYLENLKADYDSFSIGDLSTNTGFLENTGYCTEYTATKGDWSIKGYVITAARGKYMFVYHFSASQADYDSFGNVNAHLRDSIRFAE